MLLSPSDDFCQNSHFLKILSGTLSESNYLDPDQDPRSTSVLIWVKKCLQRLSANDKSRCQQPVLQVYSYFQGFVFQFCFYFLQDPQNICKIHLMIPHIQSLWLPLLSMMASGLMMAGMYHFIYRFR